ncbi:MAG: TonB-dependent receptor [Flavobacteriaceae bacterium]|nr:TonB-dependent receptor [Flavobacteriaceae bacterium]
MKKQLFFTLIALLISFNMLSQTGLVRGSLIDNDFQDPVPFANIIVKETGTGTTTDFDGNYELELIEGNYTILFSFIGYETVEIKDVNVNSSEPTIVNVTMNTLAQGLDEVVVSVSASTNTEKSVLEFQKQSISLVDGLSSQRIKSSGASNIASAVKSVPGVSVQGGKYVYVRGLGDRYTKSILNGVDIPGLDPDRNTIQMDIFPTNILDNVIVVKSASAEMPADFTGGIVDVITKEFPNSKQFSISFSSAFNPKMHYNDNYLTSKSSNTDFLGFDDGLRSIPVDPYQGYSVSESINSPKITNVTREFNPNMAAINKTSLGDYSFNISGGNQILLKNENRLGYFGSLSYKNNTNFYENSENNTYYRDADKSVFKLFENRIQKGRLGENSVILSAMTGVSYKTNLSKYKFNFLHIQNGESSAGIFDQTVNLNDSKNLLKHNIEYTQRSITNLLFSGTHTFDNESEWKLNWKISPTKSSIKDKDIRTTSFEITDEQKFVVPLNGKPSRIWRNLDEVNIVSKIDIEKKLNLFSRAAKLKFGALNSYKEREYDIFSYRINVPTNLGILDNGNPDNLLKPENTWTPTNTIGNHIALYTNGGVERGKNYDANQINISGYSSIEFKFTDKLKSIIGLRAEKFVQKYTGENSGGTVKYDDEKVIDKFDLFPSTNFIYSIKENTNLRLSYSKTTARPSFKEVSIAEIYDPLSNMTFNGNIDLKPSYIDNIDIRYEIFGEDNQLFAVSGFYKSFKDPIELTYYEASTENFQPRNLGNAKVFGLEFEMRRQISKSFGVNVNASVIESQQEYGESERNLRTLGLRDGESLGDYRNLQGQSPFLINSSIDYNDGKNGLKAGLFFNMQGETLEVVGTGFAPDVYTKPFESLNLNLSKTFGEKQNKTVTIKIENLLDSKKESFYKAFKANNEIFSFREEGTTFSIGYSIKL